jgi:hypothetical protein
MSPVLVPQIDDFRSENILNDHKDIKMDKDKNQESHSKGKEREGITGIPESPNFSILSF